MSTRTQQKALATGLSATLTRVKDRIQTPIILHHNHDASRVPAILQKIQSFLPLGMSVVQAEETDDSAALAASEAHVERLNAEKRILEARVELLKNQLAAATPAPAPTPVETVRWVTLPEAAKEHGVSYPTMWRAHKDGRLVTKIIGGVKNDVIMCDPTTYQRKTRGARAS